MLTVLASCNRPRRHVGEPGIIEHNKETVALNDSRAYESFSLILNKCKGYAIVMALGTSKNDVIDSPCKVVYHVIIKDATNTIYNYHGPYLKGFMENSKGEMISKGDTLIVK